MKNTKLSLAIAAALALPLSAQAMGPIDGDVYGKVNVTIVNADDDSEDAWELNSNASRIGVSGKAELSEGLYAIYKLEYETFVDDGDKDGQTFSQRNIIGGISGGFGTIWAGKHDTPTKLAQDKIDLFNDLEGDIKETFEGENRESNLVAYTSPTLAGFTLMIAGEFGEGSKDLDNDGDPSNDDGIDGMSASVSWANDSLYLALAADKDIDNQDLVRAIAQWKIDAFQLGLMYQQNEDNQDSDSKDESGWFVSAAYKIDKTTLKAQYGMIEDDADDDEEETFSIGADYKLAKNTTLFTFYTNNTDEDGGSSDEEELKYFGVGMEHKF